MSCLWLWALLVGNFSSVQSATGPVPVTLQALVVMLIGGVYGWRLGAVTVAAYVLDGIVLGAVAPAMPWFAVKISSATLLLTRPPVIWGFILAAALIGFLSDSLNMRGNVITLFAAFMLGNFVIYAMGLGFAAAIYYPIIAEASHSFATVWGWFAGPFIIGDILKAVIATGLVFAGGAALQRIRG